MSGHCERCGKTRICSSESVRAPLILELANCAERIAALEAANAKQAARIAELEDEREKLEKQEPVVYGIFNGVSLSATTASRDTAETWRDDSQRRHDLSGSLAAFRVEPLYTRPVPARTLTDRWRPIETGPKDGTRIMLSGFRDYETVIGFWNDYHAPAHWCFNAETVLRNTDVPTHWMPLPAAPEVV